MRINLVTALGVAPSDAVAQRTLDLLTRHVRVFGKLFRRMQRDNAAHFVMLPMCGDLVVYYWSKVVQATSGPPDQIAGRISSLSREGFRERRSLFLDSSLVVYPVRLLVQGMALFKDSLAQWKPTKKDGSPNDRGT